MSGCSSASGGAEEPDGSIRDGGPVAADARRGAESGKQRRDGSSAARDGGGGTDSTRPKDAARANDAGHITEASTGSDGGACTDPCPFTTGLKHMCRQRFALGANYAWHNFSTDFGGLAEWNQQGVSQDSTQYDTDLATMRSGGVSVIRWWVFPDFRGDGVVFDASGNPTGITATAVADIQEALALAAKHDVYLVLTLFSFDAFNPTTTTSGVTIRSLAPMVTDPTRLTGVMNNVVTPVAHAAAASPHVDHLLGWDVVNEPEWAIAPTGNAPGGQDFTPNGSLTTVTLAQMKTFINDVIPILKTETPDALTSVGWAAAKWSWAFTDITSLDFNQPHIYAWVDEYWPYTQTPSQLGYPAKPTVYGEFLLAAEPFGPDAGGTDPATFATILDTLWTNGFAGAWGWSYISAPADIPLIGAFATSKGCPASF